MSQFQIPDSYKAYCHKCETAFFTIESYQAHKDRYGYCLPVERERFMNSRKGSANYGLVYYGEKSKA